MNTLLAFLHQLHENNLGYSGLNTARSAVSNIDENSVHTKMHTPVDKHPLVCRYLKGIFNKLTPVPKFNNIWSVDIVLEHLSVLWPLDELTNIEIGYLNCVDDRSAVPDANCHGYF